MTKIEAQKLLSKWKTVKFKCIVPNEILEALDILQPDSTTVMQAPYTRKSLGAEPSRATK